MAAFTRSSFCICVFVLFFNCFVQVLSGVLKEGTPHHHDFHYVPRSEWVAIPSTNNRSLKLPVPYVVVHHTYIPEACYVFEDCVKAMRSMQNYHNSLGWGDIGYNFCVGAEGSVFVGRSWDYRGIHAGPANNHSIGICMIGDWRAELPPKKSMEALKALIEIGVQNGKIREDYKLIGHQQAMNTECPGSALLAEISTWTHFAHGKPDFQQLTTTVEPPGIVFKD